MLMLSPGKSLSVLWTYFPFKIAMLSWDGHHWRSSKKAAGSTDRLLLHVCIDDGYFTLSPYDLSAVLMRSFSPMLMNRGTIISAPVSSVAAFIALVDAVSPFTAGSV